MAISCMAISCMAISCMAISKPRVWINVTTSSLQNFQQMFGQTAASAWKYPKTQFYRPSNTITPSSINTQKRPKNYCMNL